MNPAAALLALDPGPAHTAWVVYDGEKPIAFAKSPNAEVVALLRLSAPRRVAIEMIASYGMAVGAEVFETCVWIGRFAQLAEDRGCQVERIRRLDVKLAICHVSNANDSAIRTALVDRWGGKERAIGKKASPGPLYGVAADVWAALALAVTAHERPTPVTA